MIFDEVKFDERVTRANGSVTWRFAGGGSERTAIALIERRRNAEVVKITN